MSDYLLTDNYIEHGRRGAFQCRVRKSISGIVRNEWDLLSFMDHDDDYVCGALTDELG